MTTAIIFIVSFFSALAVYGGVYAVERTEAKKSMPFAAGLFLAYLASLAIPAELAWLLNAFVLAGAVGLGVFISRFLTARVNIATFCIVASVVDYLSFSGGLTAMITEKFQSGESNLLYHLAISFPLDGVFRPLVGMGDLTVMGALFAALLRLKYSLAVAFLPPTVGLMLAVVFALIYGSIFALPFICGATLVFLAFRKNTKPKKK